MAGAEAGAPGAGGEVRVRAPEDARAGARLDPDVAARPAGQGQGPPGRVREAAGRRRGRRASRRRCGGAPRPAASLSLRPRGRRRTRARRPASSRAATQPRAAGGRRRRGCRRRPSRRAP